MRNYLPKLLAGGVVALGLSFAALPAQAAATSISFSNALNTTENVNLVEVNHHHRRHFRNHHRRPHHHHRRHYRPAPRSGVVIEFNTRPVYRPAPVYRVAPAPRYAVPQNHVNWCHSRYRSYRVSDNTFQPYNGPRKACVSPYWR